MHISSLIAISFLAPNVLAGATDLFGTSKPTKGTNELFKSIHERRKSRGFKAFVLFNAIAPNIPCKACEYAFLY